MLWASIRRWSTVVVGAAVLLTGSCARTSQGPKLPEPREVTPSALGPGDVFEVRVYDEPDISGAYRVGSDGSINFPLIGRVEVEGLTANRASARLSERLSGYLKRPHVSIFIKQYNSKKVFVLGEVKQPGTFPYEERMNIIQAITMAGGFGKMANKNGTYVTRTVDGKERRVRVAVKEIGEGNAPNFELKPGDIVYVPESVF